MTQAKNFIRYLLLTMMSLIMILSFSTNASAAELNNDVELNEVDIQVLSYDETTNRSLAVVTASHSANGEVSGNGVRLRATPSSTGQVLELMYDGEYVWIDWSTYGQGGYSWYHIQRIKTGTYGWASINYISSWD